MGRLSDFQGYLKSRRDVVRKVEERLCALQEKYESFLAEVDRTRESEFDQLRAHILAGYDVLPEAFRFELEAARRLAAEDFDRTLVALEERHAQLAKYAKEKRDASRRAERSHRQRNETLDAEEEALKERNEALLARIADHNARIRAMGRGFGFFVNLFRMRALQRERQALDTEQADIAARIESLRKRWAESDEEYTKKEAARQADWVKLKTDADAVQAKLDHLRETRAAIVDRTALELVLYERRPTLPVPGDGDPPCPRCTRPNPPEAHFCHICAQRLRDDRPDFEGSLREVAEVNVHHEQFSAGVKSCQELIGLVRGLGSGIEAFSKSVADVKKSEDKYPLPKLQIEVPPDARSWGAHLDALLQAVSQKDASLHPKAFAASIQALTARSFKEDAIKRWFETMGEELSREAKRQWK